MKLRYMIDNIIESRSTALPKYRPVGVWIQGPGPGLNVEMFYVDSKDNAVIERKEAAEWVVNRLVENGVVNLPDDFFEYHRASRSDYDGTFSEIFETDEFNSARLCGESVLRGLVAFGFNSFFMQ